MLTALVMACVAQAPAAWMPRAHGSSFELALPASAEQMRQAFTRPRGAQQLVWLPGVLQAAKQDVTLGEGPVRRLQVIPKKRGTIVLLTGRDAAPLGPQTALLGTPALLRVGPPLPASQAATGETGKARAADASFLDDAPRAWAQGAGFGMRPAGWVMWGAGCTFLLAIAYLARQRAKPHEHGSIEIVSVRSLGQRHKLALVTAGGERLLLATTDKEVILLSHLGPVEELDAEEATEQAPKRAKPRLVPDFNIPGVAAPTTAKRPPASIPVRAPAASYAPDVMGLLRLKRPAVPA